jgi:hypothetical protein
VSNHKTPLTDLERKGLEAHGLGRHIGQPSQLADVFRQGVAWALANTPPAAQPAVPPVDGDLLPPIGSRVLIHLASCDKWVERTVVGYYVWGSFDSTRLHRVFVRVRCSDGILNARSLCDVRPIEAANGITAAPEKGGAK